MPARQGLFEDLMEFGLRLQPRVGVAPGVSEMRRRDGQTHGDAGAVRRAALLGVPEVSAVHGNRADSLTENI
jgi:hypothetical protein